MVDTRLHTWELYYPEAAATGLPFARCRVDPTDVVWVHSAPCQLAVTVREGDDRVIARGEPLERRGDKFPMTRLTREGDSIQPRRSLPNPGGPGSAGTLTWRRSGPPAGVVERRRWQRVALAGRVLQPPLTLRRRATPHPTQAEADSDRDLESDTAVANDAARFGDLEPVDVSNFGVLPWTGSVFPSRGCRAQVCCSATALPRPPGGCASRCQPSTKCVAFSNCGRSARARSPTQGDHQTAACLV